MLRPAHSFSFRHFASMMFEWYLSRMAQCLRALDGRYGIKAIGIRAAGAQRSARRERLDQPVLKRPFRHRT